MIHPGDYQAIVEASTRILNGKEGFASQETVDAANVFLTGEFQAWQNGDYPTPGDDLDDPASSAVDEEPAD